MKRQVLRIGSISILLWLSSIMTAQAAQYLVLEVERLREQGTIYFSQPIYYSDTCKQDLYTVRRDAPIYFTKYIDAKYGGIKFSQRITTHDHDANDKFIEKREQADKLVNEIISKQKVINNEFFKQGVVTDFNYDCN